MTIENKKSEHMTRVASVTLRSGEEFARPRTLHNTMLAAALALIGSSLVAPFAHAQGAGPSSIGIAGAEIAEVAHGWSAKNGILGKSVYNEGGEKVGVIEDLVVTPSKSLSYAIVGAGGFVGAPRHDVALPVSQLQDKAGRFVLPGATKAAVKAMPPFEYATDPTGRERFIAKAEQDVAKAKAKLAELQKNSVAATAAAKATLQQQMDALKQDLKTAQDKIDEMNRAGAKHWKNFEGEVDAAVARLRKWFS